MDNYKVTVGLEPINDYEKAKQDFLKALNSIGKLIPQERQRLLEEFYGAAKVKFIFDFFNNYFNKWFF